MEKALGWAADALKEAIGHFLICRLRHSLILRSVIATQIMDDHYIFEFGRQPMIDRPQLFDHFPMAVSLAEVGDCEDGSSV
jgi:hypothetical protein